jgi:hypothetical protein
MIQLLTEHRKKVREQKVLREQNKLHELVKEIHTKFYTEAERLLKYGMDQKHIIPDKRLEDKANKLKSLGFTSSIDVKSNKEQLKRMNDTERDNAKKLRLIEAIKYFTDKYPNYKFITEESVVDICKKYKLVYGPSQIYTGAIPDDNIQDMLDFSIDDEDACWLVKNKVNELLSYEEVSIALNKKNNDLNEIEIYISDISAKMVDSFERDNISDGYFNHLNDYDRKGFDIAAPIADFNTNGYGIKNQKLFKVPKTNIIKTPDHHIPDPIVLCPVSFKGIIYYLVVTAWGVEAEDTKIKRFHK